MHYPPAFNDWLHELQCIRPEAYRSFVSAFAGRSERSFAKIRSLKPSFMQGVNSKTLERAKQYLKDYNYPEDAPLASGVDDTKLLPALRPYYDTEKEKWFLLGSIGEPMEVTDINLLQAQIADASDSKAPKLRLWTLSIPLPHVPPLILATSPISSKMKAPELADMEILLLKLLILPPSNFRIISLGSDGTTVEREARRELVRKNFASYTYHRIPHPDTSQPPLQIEILRIQEHAIAIIQDSKHARKTGRNGMFSGSKCFTLGRKVVYYEQVRNLAFIGDSPLYSRDVEKLDRQDDRAAARLFSGRTLEFALENLPDELGLIIYLFVFGELIDAYQSRQISHAERIKMVLRARFFKDLWKSFLKESDYPLAQHFISKEADDVALDSSPRRFHHPSNDITDIIINGLLALIIIHRDYLDKPFPLLPWVHGSEPDEHVFGFLRASIPDFTMLDVLWLIPKIGVRLMAACKKKNINADFKRTASGYSHTYFDGDDIDLHFLTIFPTDEEIKSAAAAAYEEAFSLWILLGYEPTENISSAVSTGEKETSTQYQEVQESPTGDEDVDDDDLVDGDPICCETVAPEQEIYDKHELENALNLAATRCSEGLPSEKTDKALDECGYAAAALNISDLNMIDSLPDTDAASLDEIRSALAVILATISSNSPAGHESVQQLIKSLESTIPVSVANISDADLMQLVSIRMRNQCREEAEGVRTTKEPKDDHDRPANNAGKTKPPTDRQRLAKKIHEIVKLEAEQGSSSGLNRRFRWTKNSAGSAATELESETTGNAANARAAARAGANEVS
ncbi:hypothetical protein BDZ97DRAFT_1672397 [Flammula alnicola]|nr:hypothetical protein BDZ97DRAFT_1672397 [Flammula alnicola]